ncbi:UTP--glucose-1-phosphate uridylyltransferase [Alkalihalobacillus sp. AL-G]|uniref:UTP--glucose-1-phosphate uridylyltransferase n=1 Tax=Alkalihalobacillus sp. AL-G TaxID=2926399 RepID=UPI00272D42FB|nr:UTP--glucose-1-phosphate uridylyltransferase [Alkalihalobacillus sp. AL-G]WLD94967.1 UTP--glucose-1-phosphate uridylyltransferase [Alkalihalobacillus sp. AL-G]
MVKKAIIPAAGYGTRSLPVTKVLPKEMFPINGKPSIHYIVEEAVESGIEEILIVVSKYKNMIVDYFDVSLELEAFLEARNKSFLLEKMSLPEVHIQYVRQPYARGLGDAILLGKSFVGNEPFAVLLPDDIIINNDICATKQLINLYEYENSPIVALKYIQDKWLHKYGVIDGVEKDKGVFQLRSIVEKPKSTPPSNLAVMGRYILTPDIFPILKNVKPDEYDEVQLTDGILDLLSQRICYGFEIEGERFDIGFEDDYLQLLQYMKENHFSG